MLADNWKPDPAFNLAVAESNMYFPSGALTTLSDNSLIIGVFAPTINGQLVGALAHLDLSGHVDPSFNPPADLGAARVLYAYPDAKLLVLGIFEGERDWKIFRMLPSGSVDTTFAAIEGFSGASGIEATVQADAKILIYATSSVLPNWKKLSRYDANGAFDATFAADIFIGSTYDVAPLADGKVLVAGNDLDAASSSVLRLNSSGAVDGSFSAVAHSVIEVGHHVSALNDGHVLVVGAVGANRKVVRLNADGTSDATYNSALPASQVVDVSKPLLNGTVYYKTNNGTTQSIKRLKADGSVDSALSINFPYAQPWDPGLPATYDGTKLYFGALNASDYAGRLFVRQTDANGNVNMAYAVRGSYLARPDAMTRQSDGKYLISFPADYIDGHAVAIRTLLRLNANGTWDPSFHPLNPDPGTIIEHIRVLNDGSFIFLNGENVIRCAGDGTLMSKKQMGAGSFVEFDASGDYYSVSNDPSNPPQLLRYHSDGTRDGTFAVPADSNVARFMPQRDGKIYVMFRDNTTTRLNHDGTNDTTFKTVPDNTGMWPLYATLSDSSVLVIYNLNSDAGTTYVHYDQGGNEDYRFVGSSDPLVVAGVMLDILKTIAPTDGVGTFYHSDGDFSVHVRSDGQATVLQVDGPAMMKYVPVSPTGPTVPAAPVIADQLQDIKEQSGYYIRLTVGVRGLYPFTYQWYKNGVAIAGATNPMLELASITSADAAKYSVRVSNAWGNVTSNAATLTVTNTPIVTPPPVQTPAGSRLINISTRAYVGTREKVEIAGFIISGTQPKQVVVRALGPALTQFGVANVLEDPVLTLFSGQTQIATNDDWSSDPSAATTTESVSLQNGLLVLPRGSKDSILVTTLAPGAYTAQVSGKGENTGVALIEVYEIGSADDVNAHLINISTRSETRGGGEIQIAGFIIKGDQPKRLLIRAAGPALAAFSVPNYLDDPVLTLFSGQTRIDENDDWSATNVSATAVTGATKEAHAFEYAMGSKDAALSVTLAPGAYTAQVTAKAGHTGVTLIEVYELP